MCCFGSGSSFFLYIARSFNRFRSSQNVDANTHKLHSTTLDHIRQNCIQLEVHRGSERERKSEWEMRNQKSLEWTPSTRLMAWCGTSLNVRTALHWFDKAELITRNEKTIIAFVPDINSLHLKNQLYTQTNPIWKRIVGFLSKVETFHDLFYVANFNSKIATINLPNELKTTDISFSSAAVVTFLWWRYWIVYSSR